MVMFGNEAVKQPWRGRGCHELGKGKTNNLFESGEKTNEKHGDTNTSLGSYRFMQWY